MPKMDKTRLQELINAYGVHPNRWPETERRAGQIWLAENPSNAQALWAEEKALDKLLDSARHSDVDNALLHARILNLAQNMQQEHNIRANDRPTIFAKLASWQSIAATLLLTTGIGFGIGQAASADTRLVSAEALLSLSMQSPYDEIDLYGEP